METRERIPLYRPARIPPFCPRRPPPPSTSYCIGYYQHAHPGCDMISGWHSHSWRRRFREILAENDFNTLGGGTKTCSPMLSVRVLEEATCYEQQQVAADAQLAASLAAGVSEDGHGGPNMIDCTELEAAQAAMLSKQEAERLERDEAERRVHEREKDRRAAAQDMQLHKAPRRARKRAREKEQRLAKKAGGNDHRPHESCEARSSASVYGADGARVRRLRLPSLPPTAPLRRLQHTLYHVPNHQPPDCKLASLPGAVNVVVPSVVGHLPFVARAKSVA